jgi:UDP-N-acetylmuramoyl-tripeptide--D-alanyl-D-alanine ligase
LGEHGVKVALSAVAVADMLGMDTAEIIDAAQRLTPFSGRMQILEGKQHSMIIDDTYNSSPLAVKAALDVLYRAKASKRIALLGSMNEMGDSSEAAHQEVGGYCDPAKLDVVATVGAEANQYLAPAAIKRGCAVVTFTSPYDAGEWAAKQLQPGAVVLAKGSQNGVFVEEAVKLLLADPSDVAKLVRQSRFWTTRKRQQFPR